MKDPLLHSQLFWKSLKNAFLGMTPTKQWKNTVMFVTYFGAIFTAIYAILEAFHTGPSAFHIQIALWLFFTVLFANFAESFAESRGRAQASFLRKMQVQTSARKWVDGSEIEVGAADLIKGDIIICRAGDLIAADGEVIEGIAMVDESAITGESAPVIRESGGDRSAVTAGTRVVSDQVKILVTSEQGNSFLDRIIRLVEGAKRQKSPGEIALSILLSALTIIFLITVGSLKLFADYSARGAGAPQSDISLPIYIALLVCLIPTTISALLNAIGISGMDRLIRHNVIAKSGRAVEAAGDIDLLILDKTGTITLGNRMAVEFVAAPGVAVRELAELSQLASLSDETPEGRSIVVLTKQLFGLRAESIDLPEAHFVPFSAETQMSGVDLRSQGEVRSIRKGSLSAIRKVVEKRGAPLASEVYAAVESIAKGGGTPLLVSEGSRILGVIHLKDIVKAGIKERFAQLRKMGIKTVMVTGDNALTAAAIAIESGVDDFIAEATPEVKLRRIREEQSKGHLVAMAGDGTNDAPALAQADVGLAMNTGTQASREAGNMVDLDSNPSKLIEVIEVGKQLLITRGALTTFSITNDVAKYFAIIPALFATFYASGNRSGPLEVLNIMRLSSPESAILSAVIFNALIIVALIPLALAGVRYEAKSAYDLLLKNLLIYGFGGLVAPFFGIKLIDMALVLLRAT